MQIDIRQRPLRNNHQRPPVGLVPFIAGFNRRHRAAQRPDKAQAVRQIFALILQRRSGQLQKAIAAANQRIGKRLLQRLATRLCHRNIKTPLHLIN
ncbi:hypothetical protein D3C73_1244470 [compost metagenome]